ncbi:hypothetical protein RE6C_03662 [Rhodopirellula europaea 6C]|uniref:Uncharacterized protein n=1 Tax=Rhodopirellula europaea 6C TaxID=1263867 RepID=M2B1C6_9BACT|nr:hypothetical protein RE6C_03662 [Rhodopirellula europaea 6C]
MAFQARRLIDCRTGSDREVGLPNVPHVTINVSIKADKMQTARKFRDAKLDPDS